MRIRKLTIRNVASIESAELDFEHGALRDAPLFLICGETGSGKTTILDCITLALYGKTPRYNGTSVKNAREIGGYAFNDARQLVRRGATSASAKLEIIGNDGKPYAAEWAVEAISRGAHKGELKSEAWSWRDGSEGGVVWTKVKECEAAVRLAVGLEFDQFCRTTMLAQGQFTKFLLGTEDEKADILEKLTDTSRYSELGKAIASRYGNLAKQVEELEREIAKMSGLGELRGQLEERVAVLNGAIDELEKKHSAATVKLQWRQRRQELLGNLKSVQGEFVGSFAALKALERRNGTDIANAKTELDELKRYLEVNAEKAPMLENAAVILANLGDVRNARQQKKQAEAKLAECQQGIPEQARRVQVAQAALEGAVQKVLSMEGVIAAEEQTLEGMALRQVQEEKGEVEKLRGNLQGLAGTIRSIASRQASVAAREAPIAGKRRELARREEELPSLEKARDDARVKLAEVQKDHDDQKKLIDDGIEKLVADLNVGDVCPICGNRIERLQAEGHFRGLFETLKGKCDLARAAAESEERQYHIAVEAINGLESVIKSEEMFVKEEKAKIVRELAVVSEAAERCGIKDATLENMDIAIQDCGKRIQGLDARLDEIEQQNRKLNELRKELRQLERAKESAKAEVERAEKTLANSQSRTEKLGVSIKSEADRAASKLAEVKDRILIGGWLETWENNAMAVEAEFRSTAETYVARKAKRPKLEAKLELLERSGDRIAECISRAVGKLPVLAGVEPGEVEAESTAAVDGLLGRLEECESSCRRQLESRPEGLEETDTVEKLGEAVASCKAELDQARNERGRFQQQLADDDRCAVDRGKKRAAADQLKAERDEWLPIYNYFGDNNGKKIRLEIQSYVLMNVLVKANYYLKQLSSRYELSCEGLMLSVVDAFEGGVVRPVNTLSGGEQFLVSLALALGLAGMNDTGLSVDMLLIDEGFGTLSGEHLNSAIEALERLNALTGTRRVGVISHVERLRERIHTHVEVTRNGHDPSMVKVVAGTACP